MTDDHRPAPRWGEYATPEEVERLRGTPTPSPSPAPAPPANRSPSSRPRPTHPVAPPLTARSWDRPITIGLLVLGFFWTASSARSYLDYAAQLTAAAQAGGWPAMEFGPDADTLGVVLLVIHVVLFLAAVGVSALLLRRGRLAFWVPLAAGVLAIASDVVSMFLLILLNPEYTALLLGRP